MNSFQIEDDEKDIIEFANGSIETFNNIYTGTENTIKRSFNLTHRGNEIFNKDFTNNDSNIIRQLKIQLDYQIISLLLVKK
ncbi:MAG: hypothetical protein CM15mV12_0250 [uncultured marine virus]|nr:MAG: hypothetical protein CM15mV12_0250 [uncultured marine virus]